MKKLFVILISLLLLVSCGKTPEVTPAETEATLPGTFTPAEDIKETTVFEDDPALQKFAGSIIKISDPRASDEHRATPVRRDITSVGLNHVGGMFNYSEIAARTGMYIDVVGYTSDNRTLKILAGDKDVDIYLFFSSEIKPILDNNICEPIESEILEEFVAKTFPALQEWCYNDEGQLVMIPVEFAMQALFAPKTAVRDLEITPERIEYLDGFLDLVTNYIGYRDAYGLHEVLFSCAQQQYEYYFCDFENGEFDYNTDLYKHIYTSLVGEWVDGSFVAPDFFESIMEDRTSTVKNMFRLAGIGQLADLYKLYYFDQPIDEFMNNFVSFPLPKINEKVEKNIASAASFAYINPYSENKEEAIQALEVIALYYYDLMSVGSVSNFIFADEAMYPDVLDTDAQVFREYLEMANNCVLPMYNISNSETRGYKVGKYTLDEAIAERTRVVNIQLNE